MSKFSKFFTNSAVFLSFFFNKTYNLSYLNNRYHIYFLHWFLKQLRSKGAPKFSKIFKKITILLIGQTVLVIWTIFVVSSFSNGSLNNRDRKVCQNRTYGLDYLNNCCHIYFLQRFPIQPKPKGWSKLQNCHLLFFWEGHMTSVIWTIVVVCLD